MSFFASDFDDLGIAQGTAASYIAPGSITITISDNLFYGTNAQNAFKPDTINLYAFVQNYFDPGSGGAVSVIIESITLKPVLSLRNNTMKHKSLLCHLQWWWYIYTCFCHRSQLFFFVYL